MRRAFSTLKMLMAEEHPALVGLNETSTIIISKFIECLLRYVLTT
jgi:hypothetical protein